MATKYPTALDDATTLGPTFVDAVPPADPQVNIAAEFRNNANDAVLAVQTRIGILDSTSTASIDWGLLTVSGTPNQGLRFAGDHADWPGLVAEDGLFVDTATGNVSFHKGGDPIGTFTDLTGGGGASSWDDVYATDPNANVLTISTDNEPFGISQGSNAGSALYVYRNKSGGSSTAPIMHVANLAVLDTEAALRVTHASESETALDITGQVHFTGNGYLYTDADADPLTIATITTNSPITLQTGATVPSSDITLDAGWSDLILKTGNTGKIELQGTGDPNGVHISGALYLATQGNSWNLGTASCDITHPGSASTYGCRITLNGCSNLAWNDPRNNRIKSDWSHLTIETTNAGKDLHLQSNLDVYLKGTQNVVFDARGSGDLFLNDAGNTTLTTTNKTIVGAINELDAGALGSWNDLYGTGTQMDITGGTMLFNSNIASTAFQVTQSGNSGAIKVLNTGAGLGTYGLEIQMAGVSSVPLYIHDGTDTLLEVNKDGEIFNYVDTATGTNTNLYIARDTATGHSLKLHDSVNTEDRVVVETYGNTFITPSQYAGHGVALTVSSDDQIPIIAEGSHSILSLGDSSGGPYVQKWLWDRYGRASVSLNTLWSALSVNVVPTADPAGSENLANIQYTSPAVGSTVGDITGWRFSLVDDGDDTANYTGFEASSTNKDGSGTYRAFYVPNSGWDYGLDSSSPVYVSVNSTTTALEVEQTNASGVAVAITGNSTASANAAVSIDTLNSSSTEGNANTIILASAKNVRTYLDPASFVTQHTYDAGDYKPDFYYKLDDDTPSIALYWSCTQLGSNSYDMRMAIPLPLPNKSVLTQVQVYGYWGGGTLPPTTTDRPRIELIEKDTYQSPNVTILATAYGSSMDLNTISLTGTPYTIDRTNNSYSIRFRTALANTSGTPLLYGARISYQITDLGAAVGTNNQ